MSQITRIPFSGQLIGQGYNFNTGDSVGTALEVDVVFEDGSTDAQSAFTAFELVTTQDSLTQSLGISASVDGRVGLFSGGAKMSFAEDHAVNSFSSYIAGRSFIQNAIRHGKGFRLTPDAEALLKSGDTERFKKAFGDRFVRSLNTGGEFCVIARITSVSEEHQSKLAASLHGAYSGLITDVEFRASFETASKETHGRTEVSVKMFQSGGVGAQLAFTGPDAAAIIERLKQLPQFVHEHAAGIQAELATYDTIPIEVLTEEEHEDRNIVLNQCANQKSAFLKALSDLRLALEPNAAALFDGLPSRDENIRLQGLYQVALNALMAHAIKVATGRMETPQIFVANPAPPALNFTKKGFTPDPVFVDVPNFVGTNINAADALHRLIALGLVGDIGQVEDPAHVGLIIRQTPNGGTVRKGTVIDMTRGMIGTQMPDATAFRLLTEF